MAYTPMYEIWQRKVEDALFDVLLDLGHGEDYPLKTHPWFFGVRVPMTNKNDDGLPSHDEAKRLDVVENRIREAARAREGMFVGRYTGQGNRDLLFYFPERPRGLDERIRSSVGQELLFISRADPKWVGYQQLLPEPKDWRSIEDHKSINLLVDAGADLDEMHELEHAVETPSPKGAEALARLMAKLDLVEIETTGERPELLVRGVQQTPLNKPDAILRVSWILESKSPKARGRYLGWTAAPVGDEDYAELDLDNLDFDG